MSCSRSASFRASYGPEYWGRSVGDELEISAGFRDPTNDSTPKSLIYGLVDDIEYDPTRMMISLTGRDLRPGLSTRERRNIFRIRRRPMW